MFFRKMDIIMEKQNNLISVLMPVYNVERYVKKAIDSIVEQTYRNIELIIVDDCSIDGTYNIARNMALQDNRIKLFRNKENMKISKTLNFALLQAKGNFIARMDGDDISDNRRLEMYYNFLQENKHIHLVGCNLISIDEEGDTIGKTKYFHDQNMIKKTLKYVSPVSHVWMSYKYVYDALNGYRELSGAEDYDFLLRMTAMGYIYTNIDEYLYYVRLRTIGNTKFAIGPGQIKLHSYVYKLYKEKNKKGNDSYCENDYKKKLATNKIILLLHNFSSRSLLKAIYFKYQKNYFRMIGYIVLSLCSPYQIGYYYSRLMYRLIKGIYSK
jgi:glycosyltransferase involved in cell wall biosynthesis